jgi:RND family efflux transporter MFP subunit
LDLEPLKIDRESPVRRRPGRSPWIGRLVALAVLAFLVWLFHAPILGWIDRLRLPEVRVVVVRKSSPAAAAAGGTSSNGYIVAKTRAALSADTPGRIVQMNVQEGSVVKQGDIVARLYADEYAANLRRVEAQLALTRTGVERAHAEKTASEADLARIRSSQVSAEADVAEREVALALAELEFQRSSKLLEGGVDTAERRDRAQSQLEASKAQVNSAKARLETAAMAVAQAESQVAVAGLGTREAEARVVEMTAARDQARATLDKTEVRAPFDGIVVLKDAEVGEVVSPNVQGGTNARGSVVTMVDFASLEVQAEVPETNLASVVVGRPARIYLDAFPEKAYPGLVDRIWPTANRTKATVEVRVSFTERDDRLRPEMGVRVVFDGEGAAPAPGSDLVDARPVFLIPLDAVVKSGGTPRVFVLERDRVRSQPVVLGPERSGRVVVEDGLSEGDRILAKPPASIEDGDRVRVEGEG